MASDLGLQRPDTLKDEFSSITGYIPVTARGVLLLALCSYLALGPAMHEADIVASVLSYTLLAAFVPLIIITIYKGIKLKNSIYVSIGDTNLGTDKTHSQQQTRLLVQIPAVNIPPLFTMIITPKFFDKNLILSKHFISGANPDISYLTQDLTFPHRGVWRFKQVRVEFSDQFGLFKFSWLIKESDIKGCRTIYPPDLPDTNMPVVSSCERPGDAISHVRERLGDPFDLRQYHPSDGARKILWKVFAKRGELISRHPEASMTPEGQVAIYVPATRSDDLACSAAINYVKQLESLNLQIFLGCYGMKTDPFAYSTQTAQDLLTSSAWQVSDDINDLKSELSCFIDGIRKSVGNAVSISRMVIIFSPYMFTNSKSREHLVELIKLLDSYSIKPVLFNVEDINFRNYAGDKQTSLDKVYNLILDSESTHLAFDNNIYRSFLTLANAQGWETISQEVGS